MSSTVPPASTSRSLRYGCRVNLYKQSLDSYVVATASAASPVGLQSDSPAAPLLYEQTVFEIQPADPIEAGSRGGDDVVKYGQMICLFHCAHQQPLTYHTEWHAVGMKGNLRVLLEKKGAASVKMSRWRVMPRYRLRVEGEPVVDGDPVVLQSADGERYLNCAPEVDAELIGSSFLEVSLGEEIQGYQICLYDDDVGHTISPNSLRCGDCITLLHTEEQKYVKADERRRLCQLSSPDSHFFVGEGGDMEGEGRLSTGGAEDVSYLSLFIVEAGNPRKGGTLHARGNRDVYRFRSLASGLYLQCGERPAHHSAQHAGIAFGIDQPLSPVGPHPHMGPQTPPPEGLTSGEGSILSEGEAKDLMSLKIGSSAPTAPPPHPPHGGGSGSHQQQYQVTLTPDSAAPGTLFQIHSTAAGTADGHLDNGSRIFLSCMNSKSKRIWLTGGAADASNGTGAGAGVTVASLAHRAAAPGDMSFLGKPVKSMRDGIEVRRLQPRASEELYMIRGLLPPLQDYVRDMTKGVGGPFRVRQARENIAKLQLLCFLPQGNVGDAANHLKEAANAAGEGGVLNAAWQGKLFQQGVAELALRVVEATYDCPYVHPELLFTMDLVMPVDTEAPVGDLVPPEGVSANRRPKAKRALLVPSGGEFIPMRYHELGELVRSCFAFITHLLRGRPRYAESLRRYADFVMHCCEHVPAALDCMAAFCENNPIFVELPMARNRLNFFVQMARQRGRDPAVMRMLRLFAMCGGESMLDAQKVMIDFFTSSDEASLNLLCALRRKEAPRELLKVAEMNKAASTVFSSAETPAGSPTGKGPTAGTGFGAKREIRLSVNAKNEILMVGVPHSLFTEASADGDATSIAASTQFQYRGKSSILGAMLQEISDMEDPAGVSFFPLEGLIVVMRDWPEIQDVLVPFLVEQMRLFAALAAGKGKSTGREMVAFWVPPKILTDAIESQWLPPKLHAALTELFGYTMMEVSASRNIKEEIRNIRCVVTGDHSDVSAKAMYTLCMYKVPVEIEKVKFYVVSYLQHTAMSGVDEVASEYIASLYLLENLLNTGAFRLEEYADLAMVLTNVLDPKTDDTRTHLDVHKVYECKLRVIRLLDMLLDVLLARDAVGLVDCFREGEVPPPFSQLAFLTTDDEARGKLPCSRKRGSEWVKQQEVEVEAYLKVAMFNREERLPQDAFAPIVAIFRAILAVGTTNKSATVRRHAVRLFFRLTNYIAELHATASRVQLLTSKASIDMYTDMNRAAVALESLSGKSFRRANTLVMTHKTLDVITGLLEKSSGEELAEKLSMMQHLRIPTLLVKVLQNLIVPLNDSSRDVVTTAVKLLQTAAQDDTIREELVEDIETASALIYQNTNFTDLLRTLFIGKYAGHHTMSPSLFADVVKCLYTRHSVIPATEFLCDLLSPKNSSTHCVMQGQQHVWRAIVSDQQAVRQLQFRHSWCGSRSREYREENLSARESFLQGGRVGRHLSMCRLLCMIGNENAVTKPEEIRHEVFGLDSVDMVLEVCTDSLLPIYFRAAYMEIMQSLVLDDVHIIATLFAHREFPAFLHTMAQDVNKYLHMLGGTIPVPEMEEDLEQRESMVIRAEPEDENERQIDEQRSGLQAMESYFFSSLCGCILRVCATYKGAVADMPHRVRSALQMSINEVVDALCDVVQVAMTEEQSRPTTQRSSATSRPPFPTPHWTAFQLSVIRATMMTAKINAFHGSSRWNGSEFTEMFEKLDHLASEENPGEDPMRHYNDSQSGFHVASAADGMYEDGLASTLSPKSSHHHSGKGVFGNMIKAVKPNPQPLTVSSVSSLDAPAELALSERWMSFLRQVLKEDPHVFEENIFASAAGLLLRTGDQGTEFMKLLFSLLPTVSSPYVVAILTVARQLVTLMPNNVFDDSAALRFPEMLNESPCLTATMPVPSRQSLLARWPGDRALELPLPLIALVTEFTGHRDGRVRHAALLTGCALLRKGHRGMQESYNNFCRGWPDEKLFFVLRNHLTAFKDELKGYSRAVAAGAAPGEELHLLPSMESCGLELKLIQLLCTGQFAPLQTYLVAQPDNNISVNVVEALVDILSMAPRVANEYTAPFFVQLLSTIAESLQGPCVVNQDTFVAYGAADYLTVLLNVYESKPLPGAIFTGVEVELPIRRKRQCACECCICGCGGTSCTKSAAVKTKEVHAEEVAALDRRRSLTLLQTMALSTLLALIEGRDSPEFAAKLISTVDLDVLGNSMDMSATAYERTHGPIIRPYNRGLLKLDFKGCFTALGRYLREYFRGASRMAREELTDELALAVSIYTFFKACHDMQTLAVMRALRMGDGKKKMLTDSFEEFEDKKGRTIRQVLRRTKYYRQVATKVAKIEVIRDGRLERVYFRLLASGTDNFSANRRRRIIDEVVRTSDNERIQCFFDMTSEAMIEMKWYFGMRRLMFLYLLNYFSSEINALGLLLAVAINLTMVIGIRAPTSPWGEGGTADGINGALWGMGIATICVQGVLLIQAFAGPGMVSLITGWQRWQSQKEESLTREAEKDIGMDRAEILQGGRRNLRPSWFEYSWRTLYYIFSDRVFLQQAFFFFVSIMGFVQHRIWYTLQLLQLSLNSPILENLYRALFRNVFSLILTFVLLLFVVFIFSTIAFYKFSDLYNPFGLRGNGFNCYTLSQCWLVHIDTLRSGGGVGDVTDWPTFYSADGYGYWNIFFRLAYYVVVSLIVSNLFFGMIVDSLAQFRMARYFIQTDQEKKCFICGVERNVFDLLKPGTYNRHIGEEHNMWQYIFFLYYLSVKDPATYTGQEAYLSSFIELRDVTFYPIGKSLTLSVTAAEGGKGDGASSSGGGGGGKGDGGDDDSAAAAAELTAKAVSKAMEATLKAALDPLRKKLEEAADEINSLKGDLAKAKETSPPPPPVTTPKPDGAK